MQTSFINVSQRNTTKKLWDKWNFNCRKRTHSNCSIHNLFRSYCGLRDIWISLLCLLYFSFQKCITGVYLRAYVQVYFKLSPSQSEIAEFSTENVRNALELCDLWHYKWLRRTLDTARFKGIHQKEFGTYHSCGQCNGHTSFK